jgi:hypothetical protein
MKPDLSKLHVADYERLAESLAYALRHYSGKKIARDADQFMAGASDRFRKAGRP